MLKPNFLDPSLELTVPAEISGEHSYIKKIREASEIGLIIKETKHFSSQEEVMTYISKTPKKCRTSIG